MERNLTWAGPQPTTGRYAIYRSADSDSVNNFYHPIVLCIAETHAEMIDFIWDYEAEEIRI